MLEDSKMPHEIHMAKHEGYDLEQPTKFFERYGSYVLTLMNMIKYGFVAAGLVVPPLANLKIADGLNTSQKHLEYLKKNISPLVDDAINFLQDIKINNEESKLATEQTDFAQLEALEGADLRQLESYLKIKDEGRELGNLYRIVTLEGHVKWVCFDHYKASYRESVIRKLRDIVEVNGGRFIEEKGMIEIGITSNTLAKQFYEALVKARGIQELDITLKWDATRDNLRSLCNAVAKANVIHLTVDGTHLKSPAIDVINRSQRYDPILELASNSRVQSLHLQGFDDFFSRISKSSLASAPKFRVFVMDSGFPLKEKTLKSFQDFLEHCSSLTTLKLRIDHQYLITRTVSDIISKRHQLKSLKIDCGEWSFSTSVSNGKIQDIEMTIERLGDLDLDDFKFTQQNPITRLKIINIPQKADLDRLIGVINRNPRLSQLEIGSKDEYRSAVNNDLDMKFQDLVKMTTVDILSKLESLKINCGELSIDARFSQGKVQDVNLTIGRLDELNSDYLQLIQKNHLSRLAIRYTHQEADEDQLADIIHSIPKLSHLQIGCKSERFLAIINLLIATREKVVRDRGSCCLHSMELMGENLVPFDIFGECNSNTYIQSHISFTEDSKSFDMRTWIRLRDGMSITDNDPLNGFIRQYGWSIVLLDEDYTENSTFAAIMEYIPTTRDSQLENLRFNTAKFSADGFSRLDSIIKRSPNFKDLGLFMSLYNESDIEKAQSLFSRYGSTLSLLKLRSHYLSEWLPRIASSFPTRNCFPNMLSLVLVGGYSFYLPSNCVPWVMTMVSAPQATALTLHSQSLSQRTIDKHEAKSVLQSTGSWTALRKIGVHWVRIQPAEWKTVIEAIDLSGLQHLDLRGSNITHEAFKLLVDRIPGNNNSKVQFKTLDISYTGLAKSANSREVIAELRKKVPLVKILDR